MRCPLASSPTDVCSFSRLDFSDGGVQELARVAVDVLHGAGDRIPVHVHVEHVHEDRHARRAPVHERRLIDFRDHHDLAVGRRDDQLVAARAACARDRGRSRRPRARRASARTRAARAATSVALGRPRTPPAAISAATTNERESFAGEVHERSVDVQVAPGDAPERVAIARARRVHDGLRQRRRRIVARPPAARRSPSR